MALDSIKVTGHMSQVGLTPGGSQSSHSIPDVEGSENSHLIPDVGTVKLIEN